MIGRDPGASPGSVGRLSFAALAASAGLAGGAARAEGVTEIAAHATARELGELSIGELSQVSITSVSKRPEALSHAASSVYVIANEANRSSGSLTIPEAMQLAPNLEVMRIDALDYSITARGFAGFEAANKLLVLINGRSVYTPLFSGVDWDQQHAVLDDLDRIKVISGPCGVLWGANAVNGVVSITSKSAFDTKGGLAMADLGTLDSDVRLRFGRELGDIGAGRVYATAFKRGDLNRPDGRSADDGWDGWQAGFRTDWAGGRDTVTVQGDIQDSAIDESLGFANARVLPIFVGNSMEGETYGLEGWTEVLLAPWWRISAGATLLGKNLRLKPGSLDVAAFEAAGVDPGYWVSLRSHMQLSDRVDFGVALRAIDEVPRGAASGYVGAPSYVEMSARLAWRMRDNLQLATTGQNLLHDQHPEASETRRSEIARSAFVSLRWTY